MTGPDEDITRHGEVTCPYCGKVNDAASPPDATLLGAPAGGDFALCFGCAQPSVYVADPLGQVVGLRRPTAAEAAEFEVDSGHHATRLHRFNQAFPRR